MGVAAEPPQLRAGRHTTRCEINRLVVRSGRRNVNASRRLPLLVQICVVVQFGIVLEAPQRPHDELLGSAVNEGRVELQRAIHLRGSG